MIKHAVGLRIVTRIKTILAFFSNKQYPQMSTRNVNPQILQNLGVPAQGMQAAATLDLCTHATLNPHGRYFSGVPHRKYLKQEKYLKTGKVRFSLKRRELE